MQYQWILFDADETLFHFDAYQGLKQMFAGFGLDFGRDDFDRYQAVNLPLWVDYQDGRISADQLKHNRFAPWAEQLEVTPQRLNGAFLAAMAEVCTPLPGARELISALSGRAGLGIITNGFTDLQQIRLARNGLEDAFEHLVISEEVGVAKPDLAIFEHALARMGNPPRDKVLMVGDNPHADVLGGLNAGIHTCWLNRKGQPRPDGIRPHHEVASLAELQALLGC
ncbi:pyrimidine 5'-nucleotidase [Gallaecimonas sp. GXIMD4217]|uniref:pyrimidine 5'-nucleotidase n=1 Tax=Gallaecimonas sp. GXIMD4217 TaxID=3131927 RepID=UPI00311B0237